jgi:hypothetical protein
VDSNPITVTVQPITLGTAPTTGDTTAATTGSTTAATTGSTTGGTCTPPTNASGDVDVTDVSGTAGQAVNVMVTTTKTGVAGVDLTVKFDPTLLTFTGTTADIKAGISANFTGSLVEANINDIANGNIKIAIVGSSGNTVAGDIIKVPFVIAANAGPDAFATVNLDATLNDVDSNLIAATVGNGIVTIGAGCGATTGSTTGSTTGATTGETTGSTTGATTGGTTSGTTSGPGPRAKGDVNGDGVVNVSDVREAIRVLFDLNLDPAAREAANIDNNGAIDLIDIRRLLQQVVAGG